MQAMRRIFGVQSSSDFHDHGLRLLVPDPTDTEELHGRRTFDIVFVHGLTGTWDGTWTGETPDGQKVLWPKELLKERFPTARIFSFSYDANAVNLTHRVSTQSITQHANDLLIELESVRRETGTVEHKIIFVVHSLGGLVVQKMLSLSKTSHEAYYQRIESLTTGVVFFGTPMLGADLAAWASIGTALSSVLKQTNRDIVGILEPNSSMAESIRLDITNLVATRAHSGNPIKIACFYECLPVPGYGKVVVNDKSATWPPHYQKGVQADHMNMTKFSNTQARGYKDFIGEVGRWVDEDMGERRQPSDILDHLDFAERTARQQQIDNADAVESTLDWIWSKEHESRSSFAQWLLSNQAMFWVQGKPGSGKSTLMSYIEKASRSWQPNSASDSQWTIIRFFFDFRAQIGLANNLEGFLRSLLFQILKQNPNSEKVLRCFDEEFGNCKTSTWAISTLKEALISVLFQIPENLCLLVDGLDEFSGDMHELLLFFRKIPSATNTRHRVKICLASRPHPVISLALGDWPGLQMEAHNTKAIQRYALTAMKELGVAADDRSHFSAYIAGKAEGVFLWARFAVTEVINGIAVGDQIRHLNKRLEALPSDMEELYAQIFKRMNSRDLEEAQLMFQFVCFAQSNPQSHNNVSFINLRQLKEAVAVSQNDCAENVHDNSVDGLERFRKQFKAKSGGLLEEVFDETDLMNIFDPKYESDFHILAASEHFKRNGGLIKLIHRTAESYLDREGWFLELKSLQTTSPQALWLHTCCKIIQSKLGPQELQLQHAESTELKIDESTKASLFGYASYNLFVHARLLEAQYQKSSLPFLETVSPALWRYLRRQYRIEFNRPTFRVAEYRSRLHWIRQEYQDRSDWDAVDEYSDRQPWQIIVEQGLPLSLRDAALKHYYTPPSDGMDISLVITDVSKIRECKETRCKGFIVLARQLLSYLIELGAIVCERHLFECVSRGRADLLGALLDSWPQGTIRLTPHRYLPICRTTSGNEKKNDYYNGDSVGILYELVRARTVVLDDFEAMLVLLLERGESLNEICGPGGTALHGAIVNVQRLDVRYDSSRPIQTILHHGADPNVCGPRGTPLQLAWRIFRSVASSSGRKSFQEVMTLLLDSGAESSWVEPNGVSIDRSTIEAWCAMSYEEMEERWMINDYPYCISNWYTYEFPLYGSV